MGKKVPQKNFIEKFWNIYSNRYWLAAFNFLITVILSFLLGVIFSLVLGKFSWKFLSHMTLSLLVYLGGSLVSSLLLVITKIPDNLTFGFGYGLYYGTIAIAYIIEKIWELPNSAKYIFGFIISSLVCYIYWIKNCKQDDT